MLYIIEHNSRLASVLSTKCDVCFDIVLDLIRDYFSAGALYDQDALIIIVWDDIGVRERFNSDLCSHSDLIVVQIVQIIWCLLNMLGSRSIIIYRLRKNCIGRTTPSDTPTFKGADRLFLGCHKSVIIRGI